MIEFRCKNRDKTFTPIVRNEEIWSYAEELVGEYKPQLLREPGKLKGIHFIESYLGATVDFQDIYYEEDSSPIIGATVFNDDRIRVFDREGACINTIEVCANTIILDNSIAKDGREGFANFTALHEGGHFCIHPGVYRKNPAQISLFAKGKEGNGVQCCRKADLCGERSFHYRNKKLTPEMSREHQANVFAAFAAMPRQTFIPCAKELAKKEGFCDGIIVDEEDWESDAHRDKVIEALREIYGMSYSATKIHLKELGLLMNYHKYEELNSQFVI